MAMGSIHNAPVEVMKPEYQELLRHLKVGGRWLQLAYPKSLWRRDLAELRRRRVPHCRGANGCRRLHDQPRRRQRRRAIPHAVVLVGYPAALSQSAAFTSEWC
jgi:hypothetical protein